MSYSASVAKGSNSFPLPPVPPEKKVSPASLFVLLRRSHLPGWFCEGGLLQFFFIFTHTYRNGNLQPQDIRLEIQMQGKEPWIQTEQEGSLSVNTLVVERVSITCFRVLPRSFQAKIFLLCISSYRRFHKI
ncbi:hypothetical protein FRC18_005978 [Serendipita sp. 400]|nr:hypothetical protein FRC18_005978 [Serendipita sp. 400]